MLKIAFDLDDVIIKTNLLFKKYLSEYTNQKINTPDKYKYEVSGYQDNVIKSYIHKILEQHCHEIEPHTDVFKNLKLVYNKTREPITFITARRRDILEDKTNSYISKKIDVPFEIIWKKSYQKASYLKENKFDIFVEDRLYTANEVAKTISVSFLVNQKWNIGKSTKWNVIRIDHVNEAIKRFLNFGNNIWNLN